MSEEKHGWGGARPGAGRPKGDTPPRKTRGFKLNDDEFQAVKRFIEAMRENGKVWKKLKKLLVLED